MSELSNAVRGVVAAVLEQTQQHAVQLPSAAALVEQALASPESSTTAAEAEGFRATVKEVADGLAAVAARQEAAEVDTETLLASCKAELDAAVSTFRRGEREYRKGIMESGRHCAEYVRLQLQIPKSRESSIKVLTAALDPYSATEVDPSKLIRNYNAYRLLAVEQSAGILAAAELAAEALPTVAEQKAAVKAAKAADRVLQAALDAVPYNAYRDQWTLLVERVAKDTPQETFVLLAGFEAECKAVFLKAVTEGQDRDTVRKLVRDIVNRHAAVAAERKAVDAAAAAKAKEEADGAAALAASLLATAERKQKADAAAVLQNANAATTAALEASTEELKRRQQETIDAKAAQDKAAADKKSADRAAKAAEEKKQRDAEKAAASIRKEQEAKQAEATLKAAQDRAAAAGPNGGAVCGDCDKPLTTEVERDSGLCDACAAADDAEDGVELPKGEREARTVTGNMQRMAGVATPKDGAALAVTMVTGNQNPDATLYELLRALEGHNTLCKASQNAVKAALASLAVTTAQAGKLVEVAVV